MISRRKKKRKRHWTTKNTQIQRKKRQAPYVYDDKLNKSILWKISVILVISSAFLSLIMKALDNHVVGYDHFPQMPYEWVRSLFDR